MIHRLWCWLTRRRQQDAAFVTRMRATRADALAQTRASRQAVKRLERGGGLDLDTLNETVFGRPRPSQRRREGRS